MNSLSKVLLAGAFSSLLLGCTVYPEKKPPTLQSTSSAEQHERIFWQLAAKRQWTRVEPLMASTVVWSLPDRTLDRSTVTTYLQQQQVRDYAVRDVSLQPNGADMTVVYTLDRALEDGSVQRIKAVSVWQQLKGGWVMILHTEHSQG